MQCHACGSPNHAGAKFCEQCGAVMQTDDKLICLACQHQNEKNAKFCEECGYVLGTAQKELRRKRRGWLWGVLGALLAVLLCCLSFMVLPEPPPDEQTFLPSVVDVGWQTAVQRREVGLQSSGLTGSLLRAGSAIIPQPVRQAVGDLIRQAAGGDKQQPVADQGAPAKEIQLEIGQAGEIIEVEVPLDLPDAPPPPVPQAPAAMNAQCKPNILDEAQCEAVGGVLWNKAYYDTYLGNIGVSWPVTPGSDFCHCPGVDAEGNPIQDKAWCLAEGGSWSEISINSMGNYHCSFSNTCADLYLGRNSLPQDQVQAFQEVCRLRPGSLRANCTRLNANDENFTCNCFCPNPDFATNECKDRMNQMQIYKEPYCDGKGDSVACNIGFILKTDRIIEQVVDDPAKTDVILRWPSGRQANLDLCEQKILNTSYLDCRGVNIPAEDGPAQLFLCFADGCCTSFGEWEIEFPAAAPQRNLVAPTAQTCCENVRARNVKYFRDPPGIGALFLGFDMQCADANWQLGSQCASFDALVGANRNIPWTSGKCCPDPNYPDRLNCSGSIEGQKKSMTKIVMTYGSCTAEAEFQSPYQAPVEQSDSASQPKPPSDSGLTSCPSGKSLCGGVCCSSVNCYYDSINDSYSCKP